MPENKTTLSIPDEIILSKIFLIRERKVMLDVDLAELYKVETKLLKRAVRRNIGRFPEDFMFELTNQEFTNLRRQFGTSAWQSTRYAPMAFTDHGVIMLASILNSERAVKVNIQIIRIYNKMREMLREHKEILQKLEQFQNKIIDHDNSILSIIEYINQLEKEKQKRTEQEERRRIGFK